MGSDSFGCFVLFIIFVCLKAKLLTDTNQSLLSYLCKMAGTAIFHIIYLPGRIIWLLVMSFLMAVTFPVISHSFLCP